MLIDDVVKVNILTREKEMARREGKVDTQSHSHIYQHRLL